MDLLSFSVRNDLFTVLAGAAADDWSRWQEGFRLDSRPDEATPLTLPGDRRRADPGGIETLPSFTASG